MGKNRPPLDMERPAGQPEGLAKPANVERKPARAVGHRTIHPAADLQPSGQTGTNSEGTSRTSEGPAGPA